MIIIDQEEVIEVTSDFLGRVNAGIDVKFSDVRVWREDGRQGTALDLSCQIKF